ncbi:MULTISPECIES: NADP-dependent oxidoreductase [unclassified Streptomyces]|uniref:NADP-dependent oxidoreductase n=1 Tax=unclassified Streptomyces TaxID=2593676 RepID=UPI002ED0C597|nr:NADP-dependent oxidoreductase [Streptomyces sp. NBC_00891]WSY03864.1 NADP-dependent oxidoreductase [Streptomyces sp. NBC_00890]WSZ05490.1 NADP-dependent oxidoreductase [Streptomyces sp. NBC_00869]WSZ27014.1 NADP-dependent oxidoreductase [Streptomyces sp. NBC_00870]
MPKAYVFTRNGGPEVEEITDLERPEPGPGELLVAVRAAGVNPVDWKLRTGYTRPGSDPQPFPAVLGSEAAGVVVATGPGVEGFAPGDEVFGNPLTGGYAEYTLMPVAVTAHKPAGLSFSDAAVLPVAAATAYDGVRQLAPAPGSTLLITGAGGGVGSAAVQLARHAGVRVLGVAGDAKKDFVESLGAEHIPSGPGLADRVRGAAPEGVDAVFDLVGGDTLREAAALVGPAALISAGGKHLVAELGGEPVRRARTAAVLDEVARLVVEGVLRTHVTRTVPLDRAGEALRAVEDGHALGKTVIEVTA